MAKNTPSPTTCSCSRDAPHVQILGIAQKIGWCKIHKQWILPVKTKEETVTNKTHTFAEWQAEVARLNGITPESEVQLSPDAYELYYLDGMTPQEAIDEDNTYA